MLSFQENTHIYNLIQDTFDAKPEDIIKSLECVKKKREYNRNYWQKHKDDPERKQKTAESVKEWQRNNRAHLAAKHRARYENDPEYKQKLRDFRMKYYYQAKERAKANSNDSDNASKRSTTPRPETA